MYPSQLKDISYAMEEALELPDSANLLPVVSLMSEGDRDMFCKLNYKYCLAGNKVSKEDYVKVIKDLINKYKDSVVRKNQRHK